MKLLIVIPGGAEWLLLIVPVMIIFVICYLLTLQSAFTAVAPERRQMTPGNVWLLLIPLFAIAWHFIVVNKLSGSIRAEANAQNITLKEPRPAYNIGLTMCILDCLYFIPQIGLFAGIGGMLCWVIYWVKVHSYKKILLNGKTISPDYHGG